MHDGSELREPFNEVLFVFVPLFFGDLTCHIRCYRVGDSEERGGEVVLVSEVVDGEGGSFVFENIDGCECGSLGLCGGLGLSNNVVSVAAIA